MKKNFEKGAEEKNSFYEKLSRIPAIGIIFALFSSFFIASESFIVKLLIEVNAFELMVIRAAIMLVIYSIFMIYNKTSILGVKNERLYLFIRCLFGFIASCFGLPALRFIPLGDSTAISFSSPIFIAIVARIFLNEPFGIVEALTIVLTLIGGFLISRPSFVFDTNENINANDRLIGSLLSFACALFSGLAFISIRKLQKTESSVVIFWLSFFFVSVGSVILALINGFVLPNDWQTYFLLFSFGLLETFGQLCLTLAFKLEDAAPVSLTRSVTIVFSFIYQVTLLHEEVLLTSIVGSSFVLLSVTITALSKWYKHKPELFKSISLCSKSKSVDLA
ncbi:solute carrier family 35 member G1-like protein [Dinothrombium tinctorium]|uniref:Solute carrier family 35 member G1-like protein n=1 Tax=Dinothrombium tinctorium TaxID=1965070 RepID=A0A3S3P5Y3_9ACAR|nr:solute carrier family 35 member G1-like protein [Dinothrombium tinctorium]RWS10775.1 solute carrier family 35 member G1-like protein [Dinothrombium tinctorium]